MLYRDNTVLYRDNTVLYRDNTGLYRDNTVLYRDNTGLYRGVALYIYIYIYIYIGRKQQPQLNKNLFSAPKIVFLGKLIFETFLDSHDFRS